MDVNAKLEGFSVFMDSFQGSQMQNRFLYIAGSTVYFRTSYDVTVPGRDGLGRDVRGGCDETFSVLAATKIPVGEFAVRQYGEISLAATVTPTVRPPRLNQWTPASRQDAEIAGIP